MQALDAVNVLAPDQGIYSAGQLSEQDLIRLQEAGVKTIVNLRPESEPLPFDEKAAIEKLGLRYVHIPVAGEMDVTKQTAQLLSTAISASEGDVMVHCASGNRVGALFALKGFYMDALSADEAVEMGRAAGMTKLEPYVAHLLFVESRAG